MKLGYIGLGKMGFNMVERLLEKKHDVVVYNRSVEPVDEISNKGAIPSYSISEMFSKLETDPGVQSKIVWLMVPWKAVDDVLEEVLNFLNPGDIVIDGGNSPYFESKRRHQQLLEKDIIFLDVGVSGGPSGARNGACLMVGGNYDYYKKLELLFKDLSVENGFDYMGDSGAGHFVKMIHNGIEYGMMQSIGEGFEIMKKSEYNFDLEKISNVYNHGSVIESKLIGWLYSAYQKYGNDLEKISGEVNHSGEGEWTVQTAKKNNVEAKVIEESLNFRKLSKGNPSYTGKVVSALRNEFGGHDVFNNIL